MFSISAKNLKEATFSSELDFLRMTLIFLDELNKIHSKQYILCFVCTENMNWMEKESKLYFFFQDFSYIQKVDSPLSKEILSEKYSSPEEKLDKTYFESKQFFFFYKSQKN